MESSSRTLVCSVLFLDIVEYSKKPVAEQLQLKQGFNRSLAAALEHIPQRDRIILDTGDGAAVTFMGDPEDALFAALTMRNMCTELPVRFGVNLGPVRLVKDLNGQMNIIGDGINVAQRVMSFSEPGQLLVSRSFYEVVSCLSRDYMNLFRHEGSRTDKHVREHDVYSVIGGTTVARRVAQSESQAAQAAGGWLAAAGPLGFRRSALIAAPLLFMLLVGGGVAARSVLEVDIEPPQPPKAAARRVQSASGDAGRAAQAGEQKSAGETGRLMLTVLPWGEVFVDGKSRGVSPPLKVLVIPAGTHTIEIRNSTFRPYVEKVEVKAGESVKINHRFR